MENPDLSTMNTILEGEQGQESLINTFGKVQAEYGYIPLETIPLVAKALRVAESRVYSVVTFYDEFLNHQDKEQQTEDENIPDEKVITKHKLVTLRNIGDINPEDINSYISSGGYSALKKSVSSINPKEVAETILGSGVREGSGITEVGVELLKFAEIAAERKYIICDASDKGTGASINRVLLENDPHSLIEGIVIIAYATGTSECYIYVPYVFSTALERIGIALQQAEKEGLLGSNTMKGSFNCTIKVIQGPRFLSCEPEIGITTFIEGNRGSPRVVPPFPRNSGLKGNPTFTATAETFYAISLIIQKGADAYTQYGTDNSRGTKVLAISGNVSQSGIVEIPLGINSEQLISDTGGGLIEGHELKGVYIGGPIGGFIPANLLNTSLDYSSLSELGAGFGSSNFLVLDESACIIHLVKSSIQFIYDHYCGTCAAGRLGVRQILELLNRITHGEGKEGDIKLLEQVANLMKEASLCSLCQLASNPVLTSIRYFTEEYEAHISQKKCPVNICRMSKA